MFEARRAVCWKRPSKGLISHETCFSKWMSGKSTISVRMPNSATSLFFSVTNVMVFVMFFKIWIFFLNKENLDICLTTMNSFYFCILFFLPNFQRKNIKKISSFFVVVNSPCTPSYFVINKLNVDFCSSLYKYINIYIYTHSFIFAFFLLNFMNYVYSLFYQKVLINS